MAKYTIVFDEQSHWNGELTFSYLERSSAGRPTARAAFEQLTRQGCPFARLIRWDSFYDWVEIERFGTSPVAAEAAPRAVSSPDSIPGSGTDESPAPSTASAVVGNGEVPHPGISNRSSGSTPLALRLREILAEEPFHVMYEESKQSGRLNLNPLLRETLGGMSRGYPAIPRATCDVVFDHEGETVWMEVKLVQIHNGGDKPEWRFEQRNPSFEKHLGIRPANHHSALRDVRDRLPTLDGDPSAQRIAFLMVAYDSPRYPMDDAIAQFERLGDLGDWTPSVIYDAPDPRKRAQVEDVRIRIVLWERPTRP